MAEKPPQLKTIIRRFPPELEKMGIHSERVLLYGSPASRTAQAGSDIDLIIISARFCALQPARTVGDAGGRGGAHSQSVQANGFTPQEMNAPVNAFLGADFAGTGHRR